MKINLLTDKCVELMLCYTEQLQFKMVKITITRCLEGMCTLRTTEQSSSQEISYCIKV